MQKKSASEAANVDLTQQSRDFLNQTVRDLHMAGYPGPGMYSNPLAHPSLVAYGLIRVSPTEILMEGDVNNDGAVESVDITYVANDPNDPSCPCIRRSAQPKVDADSLSQPTNLLYTETQQVFPPVLAQANPVKTCLRTTTRTETLSPWARALLIRRSSLRLKQ